MGESVYKYLTKAYTNLLLSIMVMSYDDSDLKNKTLYVDLGLFNFINLLTESSLNVKKYVKDVVLDDNRPC